MEISEIKHQIIYYATIKNVDIDLALFIANTESRFNSEALGDMHIKCWKNGKPVRARGLFQITECYHPTIADADAFDPQFSILWSIPKMADTKLCKQTWTACRLYYNS